MKSVASRVRFRGFTLLEVMLAFVLLAGAMGLLIGMMSNGLRQVRQAQSETEATLYAQSFFDELGVLAPLQPGHSSGDFGDGRYPYELDVTLADDPVPRPASAPPDADKAVALPPQFGDSRPVLYRVVLEVRWGNGLPGQKLRLATLRYRAASTEQAEP